MTTTTGRREAGAVLAFLAAWGLSTTYLAATGGEWLFPIFSLLVFGVVLTALGWWLTRNSGAPDLPVAHPRREALALIAYLAVYAVLFLGILFTTIKTAIPDPATQEVAMTAFKLLIHVALPAALLLAVGGRVAPMWDSGIGRPGFWPTLIALGIVLVAIMVGVTPSIGDIRAAGLSLEAAAGWAALSFLWMAIEAGLCEEFLFRAGLQSRLQAWLRSPAGAIAITSVIFALAHAPGLYLRGGPGTDGWSTDPVQVAAFTIATIGPISVMFGVLWWRTRSLLLVVLLHGAVDMLPHTAEMAKLFG
jgi:membrane protease YdiL (CAAX protease family)